MTKDLNEIYEEFTSKGDKFRELMMIHYADSSAVKRIKTLGFKAEDKVEEHIWDKEGLKHVLLGKIPGSIVGVSNVTKYEDGEVVFENKEYLYPVDYEEDGEQTIDETRDLVSTNKLIISVMRSDEE